MDKRVFRKFSKQQRWLVLFLLIFSLIVSAGVGTIFFGLESALQLNESSEEQIAEAPEEASEEEAAEEEKGKPVPAVPPDDPAMYLSIPRLDISNALVLDSEAGLELGAQLMGGYPWVSGSNTYIAGHRIGFPGTGSDHIFYNLPLLDSGDEIFLQDSLGQVYKYRVSEVFAVTPYDTWVMDPVEGRDMVTLQTCTETLSDWWTIGPKLMGNTPDSGRLVVQADQV